MSSGNGRGFGRRGLSFIFGWGVFLIFRVSSWICSAPMWITLILHFTIGLSIYWFWATLAAWIIAGLIRYSMIRFARWGSNSPEITKENKNPYSAKNKDV